LLLTGQRSELGRAVARRWAEQHHGGRGRTLVNVALQVPNTLLHDGHAWRPNAADHIVDSTRRALAEAARQRCGFVVHASYAFLGAAESSGTVGDWLRTIVDAALEAERLVIHSGRRGVVVRLGYLYGPESRDLRAYRLAFGLGRPYWAGPRQNLQHFVHVDDAARALIIAATSRPGGPILYATDGTPASFADFMDRFARRVGRSRPLHLPNITRQLVRAVVRKPHQQMVDLAADGFTAPRLPGFIPRYPDYRSGLDQVIDAWQQPR
jgi:nucleoside-diphosphate-sugar epimerase